MECWPLFMVLEPVTGRFEDLCFVARRVIFGPNRVRRTRLYCVGGGESFSWCASELVRTRNGKKKAAAHIRNSGLRPEILFGSFLTSAHRLRIRFSTKPPWISPTRLADRRFRVSHS